MLLERQGALVRSFQFMVELQQAWFEISLDMSLANSLNSPCFLSHLYSVKEITLTFIIHRSPQRSDH